MSAQYKRHRKTDSSATLKESNIDVITFNAKSPRPQTMDSSNSWSTLVAVMRLISDTVCCVLAFTPWIILHLVAEPYHRGFFCKDESLMYPYHESTVPSTLLVVAGSLTCVTLTILIMVIPDLIKLYRYKQDIPMFMIGQKRVPRCVIDAYKAVMMSAFGACAQQTTVNIGKYAVGRLRPHFFDVCRPDFSKIKCADENGIPLYVEEYECTGNNTDALWDMRLSFPSGHASIAIYLAIFLAIVIQVRVKGRQHNLLKHVFQAILIWTAVYVGFTRISDNKHHPTDVLAGSVIGAIFAVLAAYLIRDVLRGGASADPIANGTIELAEESRIGIINQAIDNQATIEKV